jgi:copper homeostasis protein CutC
MISQEKKEMHQILNDASSKLTQAIELHEKIESYVENSYNFIPIIEASGVNFEGLTNLFEQAKIQTINFLKGNLENYIDDQEKAIKNISKRILMMEK